MSDKCPKCGAERETAIQSYADVLYKCGSHIPTNATELRSGMCCLERQLAAAQAELARLRKYRLADEDETAGGGSFITTLRELAMAGAENGESLTKQGYAELADLLEYLLEHHDECHQPAANYQLLLDKLAGEPTNHGDCPVAKKLDEQAAELARLQAALPKTADGVVVFEGDLIYTAAGDEGFVCTNGTGDWFWRDDTGHDGPMVDECYSTPEAAAKAAQ